MISRTRCTLVIEIEMAILDPFKRHKMANGECSAAPPKILTSTSSRQQPWRCRLKQLVSRRLCLKPYYLLLCYKFYFRFLFCLREDFAILRIFFFLLLFLLVLCAGIDFIFLEDVSDSCAAIFAL